MPESVSWLATVGLNGEHDMRTHRVRDDLVAGAPAWPAGDGPAPGRGLSDWRRALGTQAS
jgi:hypothetical protein